MRENTEKFNWTTTDSFVARDIQIFFLLFYHQYFIVIEIEHYLIFLNGFAYSIAV